MITFSIDDVSTDVSMDVYTDVSMVSIKKKWKFSDVVHPGTSH